YTLPIRYSYKSGFQNQSDPKSILAQTHKINPDTPLGHWTQAAKGVMILIEPTTAAGVLVLTVVMCVGSALFAVQKVTRVDPAIVFKA
ncbi:hypothetical protein ACN4EG_07160, partial [Alkalinema pantanalense CENA528]